MLHTLKSRITSSTQRILSSPRRLLVARILFAACVFLLCTAEAPIEGMGIPPLAKSIGSFLAGGILVYALILLFTDKGKGKALALAFLCGLVVFVFAEIYFQGPLFVAVRDRLIEEINVW